MLKHTVSCVNPSCEKYKITEGERPWIVCNGRYWRKCDSKWVKRFLCSTCGKGFSNQTFNPTYRQHCPRINCMVRKLLGSKVSMRHVHRRFGINRKTVKRKFIFHAEQARIRQEKRLALLKNVDFVQADEMETHEHTKCKPLSIALAVVPGTRIILGANASEMPASGHLAEISRKKYGYRRDDRKPAFQDLLRKIKPSLTDDVWIFTDKKSTYPNWIREVLPGSKHFKAKGRRGCVVGYGEMKKGGFDPLFWINHAAAMIRDCLARLLRRTWCNTKKREYLQLALDFYVDFHNEDMERLDKPPRNREKWLTRCNRLGALI